MLIIKDPPQNLDEIQPLVAELDKAEPQVEIEAKILQTNRDTAKALGVQWGFNGRVAPELGNTTSLAFPNSGTRRRPRRRSRARSRRARTTRAPATLERTGTAVNLPVDRRDVARSASRWARSTARSTSTSRSSALEHEGKLKILSTPRVTTQNNKEAEVTQGFQIPIQIVANNTVTVQFKDAALKLDGDAADHGGQHRHHAHRARERHAGLQPRGQRQPVDQHAARRTRRCRWPTA